jgi:hypothetical protein
MEKREKTDYFVLNTMVSVEDHTLSFDNHMNRICPICRGQIRSGDLCKFITNGYILFPNIFAHSACFLSASPKEIIERLASDYHAYKELKQLYKCWT